ncbi:hypothetical protein [Actinomyces faecalis]|uniref:hypothetical protein n=1 Tax=Actinomyces faecalis TaxID=2722820 RepID=UPI001554744F|nr:hypothetical protein [Actinomyces faecalis]
MASTYSRLLSRLGSTVAALSGALLVIAVYAHLTDRTFWEGLTSLWVPLVIYLPAVAWSIWRSPVPQTGTQAHTEEASSTTR